MHLAPVVALAAIAALVLAGRENAPLRVPGSRAPAAVDTAAPAAAATAAPADTFTGPVTIEGRVVDARTAAPIAGAVVIVLRAGVTSQEWTRASSETTEALMEAALLTAADGAFVVPDLERGGGYTVMVTAEGYDPAVFEAGLRIAPDDPPLTRIEPVRLEPS